MFLLIMNPIILTFLKSFITGIAPERTDHFQVFEALQVLFISKNSTGCQVTILTKNCIVMLTIVNLILLVFLKTYTTGAAPEGTDFHPVFSGSQVSFVSYISIKYDVTNLT